MLGYPHLARYMSHRVSVRTVCIDLLHSKLATLGALFNGIIVKLPRPTTSIV